MKDFRQVVRNKIRLGEGHWLTLFILGIIGLAATGALLGYFLAGANQGNGARVAGLTSPVPTETNTVSLATATKTAIGEQSSVSTPPSNAATPQGARDFSLPAGSAQESVDSSVPFIAIFEGSPGAGLPKNTAPVAAGSSPLATGGLVNTTEPASSVTPTETATPTAEATSNPVEATPTPSNTPEPATPTAISSTPAVTTRTLPATTTTPPQPTPTPTTVQVNPTSRPTTTKAPTATATPVATATSKSVATPTATPVVTVETATSTTAAIPVSPTLASASQPTLTPTPAQTAITYTPTTTSVTPTVATTTQLEVEYRTSSANQVENEVRPEFNLRNTGTTPVALSQIKLRYWYTREGDQPETYWCDYTPVSCDNLKVSFITLTKPGSQANAYLELGFKAAAGELAPGSSLEIRGRFAKQDWSPYNQENDYSFNSSMKQYSLWRRVSLYSNGNLIWGSEPQLN